MRNLFLTAALCAVPLVLATAASAQGNAAGGADPKMSFFITSAGSGKGADLNGLAGADAICQTLATKVGSKKRWHAYLSIQASGGQKAINARDRIGKGPWFNAKGVQIAKDVAELHSEAAKTGKEGSLNEKGQMVNGRGDTPNTHDMLTGSNLDGTAFADDGKDHTCGNWTSIAADGSAQLGHHDRQGGGANPNSWNSAHPSRGCSQENLVATGGAGLFYCFAID